MTHVTINGGFSSKQRLRSRWNGKEGGRRESTEEEEKEGGKRKPRELGYPPKDIALADRALFFFFLLQATSRPSEASSISAAGGKGGRTATSSHASLSVDEQGVFLKERHEFVGVTPTPSRNSSMRAAAGTFYACRGDRRDWRRLGIRTTTRCPDYADEAGVGPSSPAVRFGAPGHMPDSFARRHAMLRRDGCGASRAPCRLAVARRAPPLKRPCLSWRSAETHSFPIFREGYSVTIMTYVSLGSTRVQVSKLCRGGMTFGNPERV